MLLDDARLGEGVATLVSALSHVQDPGHVSVYIFIRKGFDENIRLAIDNDLGKIHKNFSVEWIAVDDDCVNKKNVDIFFYIARFFIGKKFLLLNDSLLIHVDIAKIYDIFSESFGVVGIRDCNALFRSQAAFVASSDAYVNDSLLWINLCGMNGKDLEAIYERAINDELSRALGLDLQDRLNRAFAGLLGQAPFSWEKDPNQRIQNADGKSLYAFDKEIYGRRALAGLFPRHSGFKKDLYAQERLRHLRKTFLYDAYKAYDYSHVYLFMHDVRIRLKKYFFDALFAPMWKRVSRLVSKIEYKHAVTFRNIRDSLLEINAARMADGDTVALDVSAYDEVATFEYDRFFQGERGVKDTYKLLFSTPNIKQASEASLQKKTIAFFHILRNLKIKNQIFLLLSALSRKIDLCFVETGFVSCVTNINTANIPLKYRRIYSYIVDDKGFYFDATIPTRLERYLNSESSVLNQEEQCRSARVMDTLRTQKLSKYNYLNLSINMSYGLQSDRRKVLVVDQSRRDAAVTRGLADETTFQNMFETALRDNPDADVLIKTHPDSIHRGCGSYFGHIQNTERIYKITESVNPYVLLENVDAVYVCSSLLGLEALMCNKQVHVFGMPFYAGWGLTNDRLHMARRTRKVSLPELMHAVYIKFSTYFDPQTGERVEIESFLESFLKLRDEYFALYDSASFCLTKGDSIASKTN